MPVHNIMEAREAMTLAEDKSLSKLDRLQLLAHATDLIHAVLNEIGYIEPVTKIQFECYDQFMEVCKE